MTSTTRRWSIKEQATREVCNNLDWKLVQGSLPPCKACAIGKIYQQNLEEHQSKSKNIGDRWYIDGMKLKKTEKSQGPFPSKSCTVMMKEHKTSYGFCCWFTSKFGFIDKFASKLHIIKVHCQFQCKELRGDNMGENRSFLKEIISNKWEIPMTSQWTPRATTQPNWVENLIFVCTMRGQAIMAAANIPDKFKNMFLLLVVTHAWQFCSFEVIEIDGKEC